MCAEWIREWRRKINGKICKQFFYSIFKWQFRLQTLAPTIAPNCLCVLCEWMKCWMAYGRIGGIYVWERLLYTNYESQVVPITLRTRSRKIFWYFCLCRDCCVNGSIVWLASAKLWINNLFHLWEKSPHAKFVITPIIFGHTCDSSSYNVSNGVCNVIYR